MRQQQDSNSSFGNMLKQFLRERNLTETAVASQLNVNKSLISFMIRGQRLKSDLDRQRVIQIIEILFQAKPLSRTEIEEFLLTVPSMPRLDIRIEAYQPLLRLLEQQEQSETHSNKAQRETLRKIAWHIYVELETRIITHPLPAEHGLLSAALASVEKFSEAIHQQLYAAGPQVASLKIDYNGITIRSLIKQLLQEIQPFIHKWKNLLNDYEVKRIPGKSRYIHEQEWAKANEMRNDLFKLQQASKSYLTTFSGIARPNSKNKMSENNVADRQQREKLKDTAWSLHLELDLKIISRSFLSEYGSLFRALEVIHDFFGMARQVLHDVGSPVGFLLVEQDQTTFSALVLQMLNKDIRPFTAKWHALLSDYAEVRPVDKGPFTYEQEWSKASEMRNELEQLQNKLRIYSATFAKIAGLRP